MQKAVVVLLKVFETNFISHACWGHEIALSMSSNLTPEGSVSFTRVAKISPGLLFVAFRVLFGGVVKL